MMKRGCYCCGNQDSCISGFCLACLDEYKEILKDMPDFSHYDCPGHGVSRLKHICASSRVINYAWFITADDGEQPPPPPPKRYCALCSLQISNAIASKQLELEYFKISNETLLTKCCRVVAENHELVLHLAYQENVPEHLWKNIHALVPYTKYEEKEEFADKWKYATIGSVFKKFKK